MFAAPDRDTAQWSADSLGRSEIEEGAEGVSYGADPYRDGVTLTPRRELQSLALPSEITRLPNLTGYLKLPGPFPVARIELEYVKRPKTAPRFVPRTQAHGPAPDAVAPESPEPNGDTQDDLVLVPPDAKPDEHDEPAPMMAGTNGAADSAVAASVQGAFAFPGEETGNGAGDEKPVASDDGKNGAPGPDEPDPQADAGAAVAGNEEPAPENKETESGQSNGRPKPAWTPI